MSGIRLHVGGSERRDGWFNLNAVPGDHVDRLGDCRNLSFLADESCGEIYCSHVLEHLGYDGEIQSVIKAFHRVLQPGGRLRISVPDMETLCRLFLHPDIKVDGRFQVMRMLFGGRQDAHDVHLSGLTFDYLGNFLTQAGFRAIRRVGAFNEFADDGSGFTFMGVPISCNIETFK